MSNDNIVYVICDCSYASYDVKFLGKKVTGPKAYAKRVANKRGMSKFNHDYIPEHRTTRERRHAHQFKTKSEAVFTKQYLKEEYLRHNWVRHSSIRAYDTVTKRLYDIDYKE